VIDAPPDRLPPFLRAAVGDAVRLFVIQEPKSPGKPTPDYNQTYFVDQILNAGLDPATLPAVRNAVWVGDE
jgi:hypothetical protein